jgi:hypothetical protein
VNIPLASAMVGDIESEYARLAAANVVSKRARIGPVAVFDDWSESFPPVDRTCRNRGTR